MIGCGSSPLRSPSPWCAPCAATGTASTSAPTRTGTAPPTCARSSATMRSSMSAATPGNCRVNLPHSPLAARRCLRALMHRHGVARAARMLRAALDPDGLLIQQDNGIAAFQTVPHVHFHVIPKRADVPFPPHDSTRRGAGDPLHTAHALGKEASPALGFPGTLTSVAGGGGLPLAPMVQRIRIIDVPGRPRPAQCK